MIEGGIVVHLAANRAMINMFIEIILNNLSEQATVWDSGGGKNLQARNQRQFSR
jgi:hypothetical protein